ncbi:MAG: hypothetical protein KJ706_04125 [Candidatus Omnitrophica bacterium]|nr:hypothetical protein [Candidatus Omnitrophota bacterium]
MIKFNKGYNIKFFSLLVTLIFLFNSSTYAFDPSFKTSLRKSLPFNTKEEKPRIVCTFLAAIYHNSILRYELSPEEALKRVREEMGKRNAGALGIQLIEDSNGIWIYHKAPITEDSTYIFAYNDGQFGPATEKDFKNVRERLGDEEKASTETIDSFFAEIDNSTQELKQLGWVDDWHRRHELKMARDKKRELLKLSPEEIAFRRQFGLLEEEDEKLLTSRNIINGEIGISTPALPGIEEQTVTLPVASKQLGTGRTVRDAQTQIREQMQDIMHTKMSRVIRDVFYRQKDIDLPHVDAVDLLNNVALLKRYHREVQLRIQRGGEMLLEGIPEVPNRIKTEEDIRLFFNWFLGVLGDIGSPVLGNRKTTINEKAFLDTMAEARTEYPEDFKYMEDYLKNIGFKSYDEALTTLGPRQLLAYLTIGEIRWGGIVKGRARKKTFLNPDKYPLEKTELETVVIGRERRLKIQQHLKSIYNKILLEIGALSEKFNPAYDSTLDTVILAPDYYEGDGEVAHDADAARESYVSNPLYVIRVALHELRHRQLHIETGIISEAAYFAEEDIEKVEEGRINLETEVILKKVADHLGSTEVLDVMGFHLYADSMATPLDPSRTFEEDVRFVLSEYYLQTMSTMFYEFFIKGKEEFFNLRSHELLDRFYAEITNEIEGKTHSIIRDDILKQGSRDYDKSRVVTNVEDAFVNFFRAEPQARRKELKAGVQTPSTNWALENARSGYMMDTNLAKANYAVYELWRRRFELLHSISPEKRQQATRLLKNAFALLKHRESGSHLFQILSCVGGEEARQFIEEELRSTSPNKFKYGFTNSGNLIKYLGILGAKESIPVIMDRLESATSDIDDIIYAVFDISGEDSIDFLEGVLSTSMLSESTKEYDAFTETARIAAAGLLGKLHDNQRILSILNKFKIDPNKKVRSAVLSAISEIEEKQSYGDFELKTDRYIIRAALKQREVLEVEAIFRDAEQGFQDYSYLSSPLYQNTLLIFDNQTGQVLGVGMFWIQDVVATLGKWAFSQSLDDTEEVEKQLFESAIPFLKRRGVKIIDNLVPNQPELFAKRMGFKNYGNSDYLIIDEELSQKLQPWRAKPLLALHADKERAGVNMIPRNSEELKTAREIARQIDSQRQAYGVSTLKKTLKDDKHYSSEDRNLSVRDQMLLAQHFEEGDKVLQLFGDFGLKKLPIYILPQLGENGIYHFFSHYQPESPVLDEEIADIIGQENFDFRSQSPIMFPEDIEDASLDVIIGHYSESRMSGDEKHVEEMVREIDKALKVGGTLILKADGKGFAEIDYYGREIFSENYERISIEGLLNPYEWVILKKKSFHVLSTENQMDKIERYRKTYDETGASL